MKIKDQIKIVITIVLTIFFLHFQFLLFRELVKEYADFKSAMAYTFGMLFIFLGYIVVNVALWFEKEWMI